MLMIKMIHAQPGEKNQGRFLKIASAYPAPDLPYGAVDASCAQIRVGQKIGLF